MKSSVEVPLGRSLCILLLALSGKGHRCRGVECSYHNKLKYRVKKGTGIRKKKTILVSVTIFGISLLKSSSATLLFQPQHPFFSPGKKNREKGLVSGLCFSSS